MKLTKQQKDELAIALSHPWGGVTLLCDGYEVALQVQQAKGLRFHVMTYVNGSFKGPWMDVGTATPEQRYLRKVVKPLVKPAERARAEKECGKRYVKNSPFFNKIYEYYDPIWPSGKAAIAHLCKVSESIAVKDPEQLTNA